MVTPAGMPDMAQLMGMLPVWLREKLGRGQAPDLSDLQRMLPDGVTSAHAGGIVVLFFVMCFKLGMLKALLQFGLFGFLAYSGFGAFTRAGGGAAGIKAAATATGEVLSQQVGALSKQQLQLSPMMSLLTRDRFLTFLALEAYLRDTRVWW